jgi:TolB-like protein/Tfp pilus assembly protein PilF
VQEEKEQRSASTVAPGAVTAVLEDLARASSQPDEEPPAFRPGQVVGRFELVREIGHGGFGVVYEARDKELGRPVAFKALRPGGKLDLKEERLLREAEAAARLSHPNIVTLYDLGRCERGPYLVLELLHGRTLAEELGRRAIPVREALRIGVEVAKGVAHAHLHGVIHRDLTPGNVYLCDDGQVKVLDLGMAHAFGHRKVDGGTRAFMAPEQARGAPEDERTDVFALGVILHRMLSGELPFPDAEALASPNPAPELEVPGAQPLAVLICRMLEKDPVKRPRDAGEVLSVLTVLQREPERLASTEGARVRTRRRSPGLGNLFAELKRRRVIRALAGYAVVSFAVLQVAEQVLQRLHLPDSMLSVVVILLGIGFPITAALAWVLDSTAKGIARAPADAGAGRRGARLALLLVSLGLFAAAPGLVYFFVWPRTARHASETMKESAVPMTPSIAVLPFADMSPQKDQEYLSGGIAEEILNELSRVDGLKVAGRTSSFSFKGKGEDSAVITRRLNVAHLLEGSVRKDGNRVRISAQLVRGRDGLHLWSETFDRDLTGVFAIQDEIARAVVEALRVKLLPAQEPASADRRSPNPEVHEQYLLGREHMRRGIVERNLRLAAEAYKKALALDPDYAPAWAGLSWALSLLGDQAATSAGRAEAQQRSLAAAEKAIALGPGLPDGYLERAYIRQSAWDWAGAQADLERALALSPGDAREHVGRGSILMSLGRVREGVETLRKTVDLDPLYGRPWVLLAQAQIELGDMATARAALERARELAPDGPFVWHLLGVTSLLEGQPAAALAAFERSPRETFRIMGVALARHGLGQTAAAQEALEALTTRFAATPFCGRFAAIRATRRCSGR